MSAALWCGLAAVLGGCQDPVEVRLHDELSQVRDTVRQRDEQIAAQKATVDELNNQLRVARSISEDDLKKLFYPREIVIDPLTGGFDSDGKPGDDGVVVYLQPVDQYGDVLKVPGDLKIQLYDLAAAPAKNLLGEYAIPVDKIGALWHGKLMTNHYTIKCPWMSGPPQHDEITVRVTFVDYLTKRVVSAQATCKVKLR